MRTRIFNRHTAELVVFGILWAALTILMVTAVSHHHEGAFEHVSQAIEMCERTSHGVTELEEMSLFGA